MGRLTSSRAWKPTKPTTGSGRSKQWPGTPRPSAISSYHWPHSAERVACCPKDNGRRPHHQPPTGRQPSRGGKGEVWPLRCCRTRQETTQSRLRSTRPHKTPHPHGEVPWEAGWANQDSLSAKVLTRIFQGLSYTKTYRLGTSAHIKFFIAPLGLEKYGFTAAPDGNLKYIMVL